MPCPDCGTTTTAGARFCHYCGRRLEGLSEGLRIGDRRVITALFADMVGYTRLVDELDPEEVRARVDGALALLGEAVVRFGGTLENSSATPCWRSSEPRSPTMTMPCAPVCAPSRCSPA